MSKPITVTLGEQQQILDAQMQTGAYESASDVMRAALRALEREDEMLNAGMRARILEALNDPRPDVAAEDVFGSLRSYHAAQVKADERAS